MSIHIAMFINRLCGNGILFGNYVVSIHWILVPISLSQAMDLGEQPTEEVNTDNDYESLKLFTCIVKEWILVPISFSQAMDLCTPATQEVNTDKDYESLKLFTCIVKERLSSD